MSQNTWDINQLYCRDNFWFQTSEGLARKYQKVSVKWFAIRIHSPFSSQHFTAFLGQGPRRRAPAKTGEAETRRWVAETGEVCSGSIFRGRGSWMICPKMGALKRLGLWYILIEIESGILIRFFHLIFHSCPIYIFFHHIYMYTYQYIVVPFIYSFIIYQYQYQYIIILSPWYDLIL